MKRKKDTVLGTPHYSGSQVCSDILGQHVVYHKKSLAQVNEEPLTPETDLQSSHRLHDALHTAQQKLDQALFKALDQEAIPQIARLLQQGADIDTVRDGLTPLLWAITKEDLELVAFLVTNGADLNKRGPYGNTPLHEAALRTTEAKLKVAELLIVAGVNVNAQNELGQTPLHFHKSNDPVLYRRLAEMLLRGGAQLHHADIKGNEPFDTLESDVKDKLIALALRCRFDR